MYIRDISTYTHPDNIRIDANLLRKIKLYIDKNEMSTLYMSDIYENFKEELNEISNVDTKHYLHGVLRYFYEEYYSFTRDTLYKGEKKVTSREMLEQYVRDKNRIVTKQELKEHFKGWNRYNVSMAISFN